MATITKRGDRQWQAKVRRKGQPSVSRTFETRKAAEDWSKAVEGRMVTGHFVDNREAAKTLLRDVLQSYKEQIVPKMKGHQLAYMIDYWLENPLADRFIGSIRTPDVLAWMNGRLQTVITVYEKDRKGALKLDAHDKPIVRYSKTIAQKTVRNELGTLSAVFSWAKSSLGGMDGLVNPVLQIPRGTRPKASGRNRRLEAKDNEYTRLLTALKADSNPYAAAIFVFAIETAARRGEIANLHWRDVDLDERTALLRETKTGDDRVIALSKAAVAVLESVPGKPGEGEPPGERRVFPVAPDSITEIFNRAKRRCEIQDRHAPTGLTFHDLRHEATSRLFEKGLNVMEAAHQTGHKTLQMLKRYTQPRPTDIAAKLG